MTAARDAGGAATEVGPAERIDMGNGWSFEPAPLLDGSLHLYREGYGVVGRTIYGPEDARNIADAALALRPAQPDVEALRGEVERLKASYGLPERFAAAEIIDWVIGSRDEWTKHVAEVNAHALRLQDRLAASERALAEMRAERDLTRAGKIHRTREREKHGVRLAIAYLHSRASSMIDPHAQSVLNGAACALGRDLADDIGCLDMRSDHLAAQIGPSGAGNGGGDHGGR